MTARWQPVKGIMRFKLRAESDTNWRIVIAFLTGCAFTASRSFLLAYPAHDFLSETTHRPRHQGRVLIFQSPSSSAMVKDQS